MLLATHLLELHLVLLLLSLADLLLATHLLEVHRVFALRREACSGLSDPPQSHLTSDEQQVKKS